MNSAAELPQLTIRELEVAGAEGPLAARLYIGDAPRVVHHLGKRDESYIRHAEPNGGSAPACHVYCLETFGRD